MVVKKTGFIKLEKVISQNLSADHKLQEAMFKHKIVGLWEGVASGFFSEAKELTRAVDFHKGCLVVACLNRELAQKIQLLARRIINAINEVLGKTLVFALKLEI
jgi:hypothetical protein